MLRQKIERMRGPYLRRLRSSGEDLGAVTTEFVVIFPLLILMLAFIAFVSLAIAAQSEVQQVAHELARQGLILASDPGFSGDICQKLASQYFVPLVNNSVTLSASKFAPIAACPGEPGADRLLTVRVSYDMIGSAAQPFAAMLGVTLGQITRTATVIVP